MDAHLEPRQRWYQNLSLVWVVRKPTQESPPIHHAHLHVEDDAGAIGRTLRVLLSNLSVQCCRHESEFNTGLDVEIVRFHE